MLARNKAETVRIIRDITAELEPYRQNLGGHPWQKKEVSSWFLEQIELLRDVVPQHYTRQAIRRTREDARAIVQTIKTLQSQIKNAAPELHARLKSDLAVRSKSGISDPSHEDKVTGVRTTILSTMSPRLSELFTEMKWLAGTCMEAVYAKEDTTDQCKRLCVNTAWMSINYFSEKPATIDRMGIVAGLLYEAVIGIKNKDFRYLCQQMRKKLK